MKFAAMFVTVTSTVFLDSDNAFENIVHINMLQIINSAINKILIPSAIYGKIAVYVLKYFCSIGLSQK